VNKEKRDLSIRRILVALDASPHSLAALEAAVELAARFRAELLGLFVEDVNLLRLAELPFAREVGFFSATRRRLDTVEIERELRVRAKRVQRTFTVTLKRWEVRGAFRVTRGPIASELLAAASEADVLILGKAGWSLARRRRLGSTARAVLSEAPSSTLILQHGTRLGLPALVVYDGSPLAQKALATAASLVEGKDGPLTVLLLADGLDGARRLRDQADELLRGRGLEVRYRSLTETSIPKLTHLVQTEKIGTLILPARSSLLQAEALVTFLDEIDVPTLLVR
jgi:nucleotide-binding universal stress UspA family protein